jgi:hypothetical protein
MERLVRPRIVKLAPACGVHPAARLCRRYLVSDLPLRGPCCGSRRVAEVRCRLCRCRAWAEGMPARDRRHFTSKGIAPGGGGRPPCQDCWISLLTSTGAVEPSVRRSVVSRHSPLMSAPTWRARSIEAGGCGAIVRITFTPFFFSRRRRDARGAHRNTRRAPTCRWRPDRPWAGRDRVHLVQPGSWWWRRMAASALD